MSEETTVEEEPEEYSDDQGAEAVQWHELPPEREFFATPYDPPIKALIQEIRDRELVVRPTFQRGQVWDPSRKSKFVESILLNIPIPTLFFAEDDDKSKVVVDGQQRLLALKEYVDNRYALRGLEVLTPLNGKEYDDLTERQQRIINNRTLRCLVISARSDSEIRFQVFERLNQGGMPLNSQEVRHCVYRGALNDLLHELTKVPTWLALQGREEPHPRMLDCELILRFFALRGTLPTYAPPLKTILNNYMRGCRNPDAKQVVDLRDSFLKTIDIVAAAFPDKAFRRVSRSGDDKKWDASVNRAVFDTQMLIMEGMEKEEVQRRSEEIRSAFEQLCLSDERFADSVSRATADRSRLRYRIEKWAQALEDIGLQVPHKGRVPADPGTIA